MSSDIKRMEAAWKNAFGDSEPTGFVRAPGRVNLIGDHVDHQGYSVFPCAIHLSLRMLVRREARAENAPAMRIEHVKSDVYKGRVFESPEDIFVDMENRTWLNYVASAYLGVVEFYRSNRDATVVGRMFDPKVGLKSFTGSFESNELDPTRWSYKILVDGDVPAAAGLSSSAALVVGTTMALEPTLDSQTRAELCARAERYSGVASGGMDQAAILLSKEGSATHISFRPLTATSVTLPKQARLVIANTCREAPKAQKSATMYNRRVFELKAACMMLLPQDVRDRMTPAELLDLELKGVVSMLKTTEAELMSTLESRLVPEVSRNEARKLFCSKDQLSKHEESPCKGESDDWMPESMRVLLETRCGMDVWTVNEKFWILNRVRHVLSEKQRVDDFLEVARSQSLSEADKMERMGALMTSSGHSLRTDFDCTCEELDLLSEKAVKHGAAGARVTGAGWGGCIVALVDESKKEAVITGLRNEYFEPIFNGALKFETPLEKLPKSINEVGEALFITNCSEGAVYSTFEQW